MYGVRNMLNEKCYFIAGFQSKRTKTQTVKIPIIFHCKIILIIVKSDVSIDLDYFYNIVTINKSSHNN